MKKPPSKPGDIFSFPANSNEHGYGQLLPHGMVRIFLISSSGELEAPEATKLPEAFCVLMMKGAPRKWSWQKIGNGDFPEKYHLPPTFGGQDPLSGKYLIFYDDERHPATYTQARRHEPFCAWDHDHIVDRLTSQMRGEKSIMLSAKETKPPK